MPNPILSVEIGRLTGWVLGTSVLGVDTTLATYTYEHITSRVTSVNIRRGRQHELDRVEAGTASVELMNQDGAFNPTNTSSIYYPDIRPMIPIRIRATFDTFPVVAGLLARYDFSDVHSLWQDTARTTPITANDQVVKGVTDKSGNGNHLSEATNGPVYKVNIINGKSIARFDGTNDKLTKTPFSSTLTQPYTAFVVGKTPQLTEVNAPWTDGADGSSRGHMVMTNTTGSKWGFFAGAVVPSTVTHDSNPHVFCVTMNAASSAFRVDGGTDTDGGGNPSTSSLTGITLCNNVPAGGSTFAQVDFMHLALYSGDLSTADKNTIGSFLATEAGTTWTTI